MPRVVSSLRRPASARVRRADLIGRILLAIPFGYGVMAAWAFALARLLPLGEVDATLVAAMSAFLIYAGAVVWTFAARSAVRAGLGLAAATAPAALVIVLGVGR